jgi:hypothetical protein
MMAAIGSPPATGIDALGDSRRAVPAFQRQLADQRVREGVQQDVPNAGPFAGHQPPVSAPPVVTSGQNPATRHDRGLAFPGGEPVLAEPQEDSLTACLRTRNPGRRLTRDRADVVTVSGQDFPLRQVDPGEAIERGHLAQPRNQDHIRQPGADLSRWRFFPCGEIGQADRTRPGERLPFRTFKVDIRRPIVRIVFLFGPAQNRLPHSG